MTHFIRSSGKSGEIAVFSIPRPAVLALIGLALTLPGATTYARASSAREASVSSDKGALPDYRLNIRDRVRVQVFEWRPSRDEVFTWTAINQIYTIDPSGKISLPLVGSVSAAGFTTSELETLISRQLAVRLKLATLPNTTIEVTDFRPIFVTGAIEKPGEYPYTAGMNVLQGVSLGGGLFRNSGASGLRLEREFLTTAGTYKSLRQERQRLLARKARLDAELASADRIAFPAELQSINGPLAIEFTASIMTKEQSVFDLRRKAYDTQISALDQLQHSLQDEVDTLDKRVASEQKQIDLLKSELSGIQVLSNKGLATQPRLLGLQRNLAELEGEKLRIESDRTRAQQEVSRTKISKIEYQNKRDNDLTVELQTTEARLEQISQESAVDERLLAETRSQATMSPLRMASIGGATEEESADLPKFHYTIVRQIRDETIEIEATEKTLLQPGDTIKIDMAMPAASETFNSLGLDASFGVNRPTRRRPERTIDTLLEPKAPTSASI